MEIVGQFNLAFIIARRRHAKGKARETGGHDDLMIIESVQVLGGAAQRCEPSNTICDPLSVSTLRTRSTTLSVSSW
jgi:hypothetical protein